MALMLAGAVAMANLIIGLFFLRFRMTTRDRFFSYFAACFMLEGLEKILIGAIPHTDEDEPLFYIVRLAAYAMILLAILDKNRSMRRKPE